VPLIQVELIENMFTLKSQIITKPTEAMASIEGENMRPVTSVVIEEVRSGEWDSGGQALTTDAVQLASRRFLGMVAFERTKVDAECLEVIATRCGSSWPCHRPTLLTK
jgi:4-oxalocrotonate tautomerase